MEHIRKQYEKRARSCVLGTVEEPIEWAALGLGLKVSISGQIDHIDRIRAIAERTLMIGPNSLRIMRDPDGGCSSV